MAQNAKWMYIMEALCVASCGLAVLFLLYQQHVQMIIKR